MRSTLTSLGMIELYILPRLSDVRFDDPEEILSAKHQECQGWES